MSYVKIFEPIGLGITWIASIVKMLITCWKSCPKVTKAHLSLIKHESLLTTYQSWPWKQGYYIATPKQKNATHKIYINFTVHHSKFQHFWNTLGLHACPRAPCSAQLLLYLCKISAYIYRYIVSCLLSYI